ncbi:MAG TPA: hypothetical protein VGI12_02475 [Vicinamibacterales bacterium]
MIIKRIVSVVIFLLLGHAVYRLGTLYFHDQQFKDAVREYAILAGQPPAKGDEVVKQKVMDLAQENQIPLDPDYIEVSRQNGAGLGEKITIKFAYAEMVPLVPGFDRRFDFSYTTP